MKGCCTFLSILFTATVLPVQAALQNQSSEAKRQPLPAVFRQLPSLQQAGPVWRSQKSVAADSKRPGILCRNQNPADLLQNSLFSMGLSANSIAMAENGTLAFISGNLGAAAQLQSISLLRSHATPTLANDQQLYDVNLAISWLHTFAAHIGLDCPEEEFSATRCETDGLGKRHVRLQQQRLGIPVWAHDLYVHIDSADKVYAVNGRYAPTPREINTGDVVWTSEQAVTISHEFLNENKVLRTIDPSLRQRLQLPEPTAEKAIWVNKQGRAYLVWQVDLYANIRDRYTLFVDAQNGTLLHYLNNTATEGPVNASGLDVNGVSRAFRAYEEQGAYYMLSDINELAGGSVNLPNDPTGGLLTLDLQNNDDTEYSDYYFVTSNSATQWSSRSAVSASCNLATTYHYYKNVHGRRAIDNKASTIITVVNVTEDGAAMDNAYWNGRGIYWGNGKTYFKPLAVGLDVAAHEYTHGVTEYTANLIYQDQSGALNEAMSDFFGAMVDNEDWFMGEDVMLPGRGSALRDMANPGNPNVKNQLPASMDQYFYTEEDQGGVHTNCGIINRASYLIAGQIGREKAEKIYYRALTNYLTRQSEFLDARNTLELSAQDLYGDAEVTAVKNAFDAVHISPGSTQPPRKDDKVNPTIGGRQWIAFVRNDLQIGFYDVISQIDYFIPNIYVKTQAGNYSQLTATADGRYLYFVNKDGKIARLDLSQLPYSYNYEVFNNIYARQPGDIWNVAVTRDNVFLAFTSMYSNDNTIYFYINNSVYYLTLEFPTTQTGITGSTIRYPDVIAWSPNAKYPKLAFDAYNEIDLSGGKQRNWWSMGEIDFTGDAPKLYALLPAQADGISAGNVQYSSTNPNVIIYSYIDDINKDWDIKIHDFTDPAMDNWIVFPDRKVERPSFSPDDQRFVVDRFSDAKLLICDITTLQFQTLSLTTGARYPKWIVIGGKYDTKVASAIDRHVPATCFLAANYPNPFNNATQITFHLDKTSAVLIEIFDINGRLVRTLVNEQLPAGYHVAPWDGCTNEPCALPSGVYLCRMSRAGRLIGAQKMMLVR